MVQTQARMAVTCAMLQATPRVSHYYAAMLQVAVFAYPIRMGYSDASSLCVECKSRS
jgi:hypothetical protein